MYLTKPFTIGGIWHKVRFSAECTFSDTGYLTKVKVYNVPCYLPIAGGRTDGFMFFLRALARRETQTASSRFWTRVTDSISNDDNHYAKRVFYISFGFSV